MEITQFLKREIPESNNYSFVANITTSNTSGLFSFGLSGDAFFNIQLESGSVYTTGLKIGSYNAGEQLRVSGQIGDQKYDLFINENPIILGGQKSTGNLRYVFANSINQTTELNLFLANNPITINKTTVGFYLSGQSGLTGQIIGDKRFTIFSGKSFSTIPFTLSGFSTSYSTNQEFYIQKTVDEFINYDIPLTFYTSLGEMAFIYSMTGFLPNQSFSVYSIAPQDFTVNIRTNYLVQTLTPTGYVMGVCLSGISGTNYAYDFAKITGTYTGLVSGYLTGSGTITNNILITGSGLNLTGQLATGQFITGFTSTFMWATGIQTGFFLVTGSGVGSGLNFTGISTGYFNFQPTFTIFNGSGTYLFSSGTVTGTARDPIYREGTTTQVWPVSEFSGTFSGTATGTGFYYSTGLANITGSGSGYLLSDVTTRRFTDVWKLKTGFSQLALYDYYPDKYFTDNLYSGANQTFLSSQAYLHVVIEHSGISDSRTYISKLIINGTNHQEYLITGQS